MINTATGQVSAVAGSPFNEGMGESNILQVAAEPTGRFLYVLNLAAFGAGQQIGSAGIVAFSINHQNGVLTLVAGGPVPFTNSFDESIAFDGAGHFVFGPKSTGHNPIAFDIYAINQNTGALTLTTSGSDIPPVGNFTAGSRDGRLLFNAGNGLVASYAITASSGQLSSTGPPLPTLGSGGPVAASSDGKFIYVANQNEGTVAVFAVGASGALTPVATPFNINPGAQAMSLTPDGKFLYIATSSSTGEQVVSGYAVNPAGGIFAAIPGAIVKNASVVTIDLSGKFAYVGNVSNLFTESIDPTTGALTVVSTSAGPTSDDANDLTTAP